jgi:2-keto-4-pentenoate hydratase/2-oxohepta-3-ene-1,7-dioic acid hydratase in catechol pathway
MLTIDEAPTLIAGYGVGIDITARDLQRRAQSEGNPWTVAKGYDGFAPISDFVPAELVACPGDLAFELSVNGVLRQKGNTQDMLFGFGELVAFLSRIFTLQRGDLIFTGTPAGVATISSGDVLTARLPDYQLSVSVVADRA